MATKTEKKLITAYDGTKIDFYVNSHRYKEVGEKTYLLSPSNITKIIDRSTPLMIWNDNLIKDKVNDIDEVLYNKNDVLTLVDNLLNLRNEVLEEAGETGDVVHNYAEQTAYAKAFGLDLPEIDINSLTLDQVNGITAFTQFNNDKKPIYLDAERFVFSKNHKYKYIGKFDTILEFDNKKYLGDFKTSKSVYFAHMVQLALYDLALIEEYKYRNEPLPYDSLCIIHIDKKTGEYTIYEFTEEERLELHEAGICALGLKALEKKYNKWKKDN